MPEPFDLAPEPMADPLDVSGMVPARTPAAQAPAQPQGHDKAGWIRLAALLPLALKGGPGAVEGLLAGWQQAQARKQQTAQQGFQNQRLVAQDARQVSQDQALAQYRQQTLQQQEDGRRQTFLQQFTAGLAGLDDPESVRAYLALQQQQGKALGINPAALESYVLQTQTPSTVQKRQAEKTIGKLKSQFGEKWMEQGSRFRHQIGGEEVPFDEVLRRAGMTADPNAPPVAAPDKRGFAPKDVTVNGKRILANFDPDKGLYYAPGSETPLAGDIQEYTKPAAPTEIGRAHV